MSYKIRIIDGIQDTPLIYGNASTNITPRNRSIPNTEDHTNLFTMKLVSTKKTQGREKNILNQAWVNVTLKTG